MILGRLCWFWQKKERERERERAKKKPYDSWGYVNSTITYKFRAWHYVDSKISKFQKKLF